MNKLDTILANTIEARIEAALARKLANIDTALDSALDSVLAHAVDSALAKYLGVADTTATVSAPVKPASTPTPTAAPSKGTRRGTRGNGRKTREQREVEAARNETPKIRLFANGRVDVRPAKSANTKSVATADSAYAWTPKTTVIGPRGGILTRERPVELKDFNPGQPEYLNVLRSRLAWVRKQAEKATVA